MARRRDDDYEDRKERERRRQSEQSSSGRDIGSIPPVSRKSITRRNRSRDSLRVFCETYNPEAFNLGWSRDHLRMMERIEDAARGAALFAFAMPRGSGKTTICRMAALWAVSYNLVRYVFLIGANASKAEDSLSAIRTYIRFLPEYAEDFPEISYPVQALGGIANRASGQLCCGEPTMIGWGKDRVILPTVPTPKGWPKAWGRREDGMVPTSGAVIGTSGLTGDGIRGSVLTLTTGEAIRPDLVLLDDPQSDESARSITQNAEREQLISAGVLGMAGPRGKISAVMPCTVIQCGDMVDCLLDRKKHPLWRGERTRLLRVIPKDLTPWETYFEIYRRCAQLEPPDYAESNAYYRTHQSRLEQGFEASWPERKAEWEVTAIQSAMHIYARDPRAFWSEYQNDPLPLEPPLPGNLTADQIASRVNQVDRGIVPSGCTRLTAFIDIQADLLYWAVCAWTEGFGGAVIDYGTFPNQRRAYFSLREANPTLGQATGIGSLEGSVFAGLQTLSRALLDRDWRGQSGAALRIERLLIDAAWGAITDVARKFCRQSPHSTVITPSYGRGIGAGGNPIEAWPKKDGERRGNNWIIPPGKSGQPKYVIYDANFWKSYLFTRLGQHQGERGAMTLFGADPYAHRLFADHLTAEYRVHTQGRGRELQEWKLKPHRPDNHWLDCASGCCVAASLLGLELEETSPEPKSRKQKRSWKEMQRQKQLARQKRSEKN